MKRREFMAVTSLAGLGTLPAVSSATDKSESDFIEWRHYIGPYTDGRKRMLDFLKDAAVPAWNRLGLAPIGVFTVLYGPNQSSVYVLLPHKTIESVIKTESLLSMDADFINASASFMSLSSKDPGYWRIESSLLQCFSHMPQIEAPDTAKPRLFELRIYESHNEIKSRKKIQMFNQGGEIEIFRKTGFKPVFFAETIVGPKRPNLHYMLSFGDMTERDKTWAVFRNHPDWLALKDLPEYSDTVCNITDLILQPANFSQI
jgi:hypothetical protein